MFLFGTCLIQVVHFTGITIIDGAKSKLNQNRIQWIPERKVVHKIALQLKVAGCCQVVHQMH